MKTRNYQFIMVLEILQVLLLNLRNNEIFLQYKNNKGLRLIMKCGMDSQEAKEATNTQGAPLYGVVA